MRAPRKTLCGGDGKEMCPSKGMKAWARSRWRGAKGFTWRAFRDEIEVRRRLSTGERGGYDGFETL